MTGPALGSSARNGLALVCPKLEDLAPRTQSSGGTFRPASFQFVFRHPTQPGRDPSPSLFTGNAQHQEREFLSSRHARLIGEL